MINDYFDLEGGVDTDDYVRALYAPHPILSGWVTKRQLATAILIANAIDLAILLVLMSQRGPARRRVRPRRLFVSVFYVAPPIRLKHIGLGEPGVFIVWGPLMVVGHVLRRHRHVPAVGVDRLAPLRDPRDHVLFGKHIDKIEADTKKGVRTMPVLLGESRARRVAQGLMIAFYPIIVLRGARRLDRAVGAPRRCSASPSSSRSLKVFDKPKPDVAAAQLRRLAAVVRGRRLPPHPARRRAAVLGLLLNALLPIKLPWL